MPQHLQDQVVFVTGASSGIGHAIARAAAAAGAVVVGTSRDVRRLDGHPALRLPLALEVTDAESVASAAAAAEERLGRVDVLIHCAGVGLFQAWHETSIADYQRLLDINLLGPIRLTQALLPGMVERGRGAVVHIASVAGQRGYARHSAYCASKHALLGWSRGLRKDLQGTGVQVLDICPPAVDTPFFDNAGFPDYRAAHPGLTMMSPEDVAAQTLEALARGERQRTLSRRAQVLWALDTVSPAAVDLLQRLKKKPGR